MSTTLVWDGLIAIRRLRRAKGFVAFSVLSLGVAIGVATAVVVAVRSLLWTPSGIPHERSVYPVLEGGQLVVPGVSWPDFLDLRASDVGAAGVAASRPFRAASTIDGQADVVQAEAVSGDYFATLGVVLSRGRLIGLGDERGSAKVAVISEAYWRSKLGASEAVVGKPIRIASTLFEVVGVARDPFKGLDQFRPSSVWVPMTSGSSGAIPGLLPERMSERGFRAVTSWVRVASSSHRQAKSEALSALGTNLDSAYGHGNAHRRRWSIGHSLIELRNADRPNVFIALVVAAAITLVLLASMNVANLSLARGIRRRPERLTCLALGATRWNLIREQAVESLVIAMLSAITGFIVFSVLRVQSRTIPLAPDAEVSVVLDGGAPLVGVLFAFAAMALVVSGLWPAFRTTRAALRPEGHRWRLHGTLVAWQAAGSVALFIVAGASLVALKARERHGFTNADFRDIAIAQLDLRLNGVGSIDSEALASLANRLSATQEIAQASASTALPVPGEGQNVSIKALRSSTPPEQMSLIAGTPSLFSIFGLRILRGRTFSTNDTAGDFAPIVVSEHVARRLFGSLDAVAHEVQVNASGPTSRFTIVGILEDPYHWHPTKSAPLGVIPLRSSIPSTIVFASRGPTLVGSLTAVQQSVKDVAPNGVPTFVGTAAAFLGRESNLLRSMSQMAAGLGLLILLLAMTGLYGVLSALVQLRTLEIGIRSAVGATPRQIMYLVTREGLQPVIKGLLIGMSMGTAVPLVAKQFMNIEFTLVEPWMVLLIPVPFFVAAVLACVVPATAAAGVPPSTALRNL